MGGINTQNYLFICLLNYNLSLCADRRSEIQQLSKALAGDEVLMIDGLLEDAVQGKGKGSIAKVWEKEGGSGLYPPPSLHALLSMFLLPDVSTTTKHRIVQYLFLDLASLLSDG